MAKQYEITYAERAGMYLKAQLLQGRKAADKAVRKGYRDAFAEKLGVDPRTLSRYCIAIHDVDTIAEIAALLGVSIGDMLSYDGEDVPVPFRHYNYSFYFLPTKTREAHKCIQESIFL